MSSIWASFYASELQGLWLLSVPPALWLAWMLLGTPPATPGAEPRAAGFVRAWALVFTLETILDPPLIVFGGLPALLFVLLGDFRVFLLVFGVARPDTLLGPALAKAALWTTFVPIVGYGGWWGLDRTLGPLHPQTLWLLYELCFLGLALWMRGVWLPRQPTPAAPYLRAVLAYVALYYGLWAQADVLILLGVDLGWLLRVVPNQLYYVFWVPVAFLLFFAPRYAASSSAVHAAR
ncbi:MAG: hypothetical protein KIT14_10160 [bacterium]|nr:hypothetical protein [bacterium]